MELCITTNCDIWASNANLLAGSKIIEVDNNVREDSALLKRCAEVARYPDSCWLKRWHMCSQWLYGSVGQLGGRKCHSFQSFQLCFAGIIVICLG
ncbi:hypothetical protein NC652_028667 [Populus alba x Populus x berolinensis]|nr:hypothetical protein NC652_028667 [Populus alba x Populus x berolinensis]